MVMCSNCHKRVAVIFVTKVENGVKSSQGLCVKCAKDLGLPVENMLGDIYKKMGISPEQMESMEEEMSAMLQSDDGGEDGGAPAIDLPQLFKDSGILDTLKSAAENMPQMSEGANIVPVDPNASQGGKNNAKNGGNDTKSTTYDVRDHVKDFFVSGVVG